MLDTKQIQESQRTPSRIYSKITTLSILYSNFRNPKIKKKFFKEAMVGAGTLHLEEQRAELNVTCPQKPHNQEESRLKYLQR